MTSDLGMKGSDYNIALFVFFIPVSRLATIQSEQTLRMALDVIHYSTSSLKCRPTL